MMTDMAARKTMNGGRVRARGQEECVDDKTRQELEQLLDEAEQGPLIHLDQALSELRTSRSPRERGRKSSRR